METRKSVDSPNKISSPDPGQENVAETKPGQIVRDLQITSLDVYRQDVVRSKISGKLGIVTEVAGDSGSDDSESDDDDEDDDDEDYDEGNGDDGDGEKYGEACDDAAQVKNDEKVNQTTEIDGPNTHHLPIDQVRVIWIDESESTEKIDDLEVLDRGFLPGDYVASASDPTGQLGVVVDVNMFVDLLTHNGSIIKGVNAKDVRRVRDFTIGDYVIHGPWLGRIDDILDNVTVLFDDGSMCKVLKADPLRLKPVSKNILEDGHFPFYPGQRVRATSSSVFKNSRWLSGAWKANRMEGTVTSVIVGSVFIYWIASAGYGPDSSTSPAEELSPQNLKLMSCFLYVNWQLGDWCLPPRDSSVLSTCIPRENGLLKAPIDCAKEELQSTQAGTESVEAVNSEELNDNCESIETDAEESFDADEDVENKGLSESSFSTSSLPVPKESVQESWPLHRKKIRKVVVKRDKKARKKEDKFERAVLIVNTRTRVDVAWQDGTIGHDMVSASLIPIETPGDHDFVAEQYVIEKAADDVDDTSECRRVGVVQGVNAKEKTANVRWFKQVSRAEDPKEFDKEEVVSVYELEGHPDYDYCVGDVVVRLSPVSTSTGTVPESEKLQGSNEDEQDTEREACTDFSDLSWVGNITGLRNGDIEVTWADGMVSTVGPQAIYVVGRDDDESIGGGSEVSDDAASWETVEDDETETLENATQENGTPGTIDISLDNEDGSESSGRNGVLTIPLAAALGRVWGSVTSMFARREQVDPNSRSEGDFQNLESAVRSNPDLESSSQNSNGDVSVSLNKKIDALEPVHKDPSEVLDVAETLCSLKLDRNAVHRDNKPSSFKGFDISKDPYDHYFLSANDQSNSGKKWLRKVHQDWNILQNNLPDGIYVRVYEDRMDLLRAVIVGAYGTPYQDGLFFFDFHLPPDYPDIPPSAYYHSGGWRINPNLYEEGKVCLSLLNTWTGRGNEIWDPSSSSILQVLVSLQGLVLNSKPYFNEAGYDKQVGTAEGEKNSLSYNENTFLLNCKSMMYLMRKPPKDFENLIKEHFRRRGYYILKACDAYMKGYLIGSLAEDASIVSSSGADSNTIGFKIMLAKLAPKLYRSLSEIGADCQEFNHLQND